MAVSVALAALALVRRCRRSGTSTCLPLLAGIAQVFDSPGRHALVFQLVGRGELPNAIALNSSVFNASRIVGPGIAGLLIASVGVGACFAVNAVSFVAVLAALLLMDTRELHPWSARRRAPRFCSGVREGLSYARGDRRVRLVLLLVLVVGTLGVNNGVILPVLATELHGGTGGLRAALGRVRRRRADRRPRDGLLGRASWKVLLAGTTGFGVAMLAVAPQSTVIACAAAPARRRDVLHALERQLQLAPPADRAGPLRGRILSLYLFAFHGLAPAGGLLIGWLIEVGGTDLAFEVAGISALAMAAVLLPQRPFELRDLGGFRQQAVDLGAERVRRRAQLLDDLDRTSAGREQREQDVLAADPVVLERQASCRDDSSDVLRLLRERQAATCAAPARARRSLPANGVELDTLRCERLAAVPRSSRRVPSRRCSGAISVEAESWCASFCERITTWRATRVKRRSSVAAARCAAAASPCGEPTGSSPSTIWWTRWWLSVSASAISRIEPPAACSRRMAWW